jgi:hypothetical protein
LAENAPLPIGKKYLAKLTGWIAGKAADKLLSTFLPGDYTLVNILIELKKGNIDMEHFKSPNSYLSIVERKNKKVNEQREIDAIEDDEERKKKEEKSQKKSGKVSEIPEGSEFALSYVNNYKTESIEYHRRELSPKSDTNDHCLECLFRIKGDYKFLFIIKRKF